MKVLLITNNIVNSKKIICGQIQSAWEIEVKNDKRKTEKNFLLESDYLKIVDCREKLETLDKNFIPEIIFIVPELNWSNDDVNEGYDIARELITKKYKSDFIQLVFISVLERTTLKKISDVRNKGFVEAFPHACLLDSKPSIQFSYYSDIHYKLIKHLAISDEGRLQRISHEMNSVKTNISKGTREVGYNRTDLIAKLEELFLFQQWTGIKITDEIETANNATTNEQLASISKTTENIIDEINIKLPKENDNSNISLKYKSNYKVFIVEDDTDYKQFFYETISRFYSDVYPNSKNEDFVLSNAREIIRETGKNYNIFLLDLLYKDQNGWLPFNGLDLYKLIRKINPYAAIRIITSLPRGIVSKLVDVIMIETEKPNINQVFTKKYGYEQLKDSIIESIDNINEECRLMEKQKTVWMPIPKEGIFSWESVKEMIISIDPKDMEAKVSIAKGILEDYKNNKLNKNTNDWSQGMLTNTRKEGDYVRRVKERLVNIMVHRLIVLSEALKNKECKIYYADFKAILSKICNLSPGKNYFQTKLGFNGIEYSKEADKAIHWFQVTLTDLFPHEYDFYFNFKREKDNLDEEKPLKTEYPYLNTFFLNILTDTSIYDVWDELNLDFNAYDNVADKIENGEEPVVSEFSNSFTLKNVRDFFQSLIYNYSKDGVSEIVNRISDFITENYADIDLKSEDDFTTNIINALIEKDLKAFNMG